MRATATVNENDKITLRIEVEEPEIVEAVDQAAHRLAREINVKGFRKGKAPRQVIEARIGGPVALRMQAVNDLIPDYYAKAVSDTMVDPIGEPEWDIESGAESGELVFTATVDVRPEIGIIGYDQLKVTIPSPVVTDAEIERQINRIRETDSELRVVDRPVVTGDVLVVDVTGVDPSGEAEGVDISDFSYTVGSGAIAEGIDETIVGLRAGETLEAIGRRGPNEFLKYDVVIKTVQERILPDLTDEWVEENTEYANIDALREGLLTQLSRMRLVEAKFAQRDAALLALSDLIDEELAPEHLVNHELEHRVGELSQRLSQQGISFEYFMEATGQSSEELVARLKEDAVRGVRVDLALRALARAEGLEPSEEEVADELERTAESMSVSAETLRDNLRDNGRTPAFYAEIAKLNASKWLMANVTYIDELGAEIDKSLLEEPKAEGSDEGSAEELGA